MTAAEGTARWQAVEQVRDGFEHLHDDALPDGGCTYCAQFAPALAALSLLEQLAEAADGVLDYESSPSRKSLSALRDALAAVRSGRVA